MQPYLPADVGIAISNGAEITREIADITVGADDLGQIVTLRRLSNRLMKRIQSNYRFIVGFNSGLIVLGVTGVIQPTTSSLLSIYLSLYGLSLHLSILSFLILSAILPLNPAMGHDSENHPPHV